VKVLLGAEWGVSMPVDARSQVLRLPRRVPNPDRVKQCTELAQKDPAVVGHAPWVFAKEIVLLDALLAREPSVEAEVQAIQLGPAVFASMPGEVFCQFGLDLKAAGRFPFTFPVELANGCVGYVPTEEALGEHGGGYETRLTSYTNLEPDAGRRMSDAVLSLMGQMKAGPVVSTRPAPAFNAPWSYGNVPPELN
jgi:neutral ceramidase